MKSYFPAMSCDSWPLNEKTPGVFEASTSNLPNEPVEFITTRDTIAAACFTLTQYKSSVVSLQNFLSFKDNEILQITVYFGTFSCRFTGFHEMVPDWL